MTKTERKRLAKVYRDAADILVIDCVMSLWSVTNGTTVLKLSRFFADFTPAAMTPDEKRIALNFFAAMVEAGDA